jgi:hypothetical protein
MGIAVLLMLLFSNTNPGLYYKHPLFTTTKIGSGKIILEKLDYFNSSVA